MNENRKKELGRRAKDSRMAKVVYFTKPDKFDSPKGLCRNLSEALLYDADEPDEQILSNYDLVWRDEVEIWKVVVVFEAKL